MKTAQHGLVMLGLLLASGASAAVPQDKAAEDQEEKSPPRATTKLPDPLSAVAGNLVPDLEATGFFTVTKVEFARTKELDEEALIWTVKVVQPLGCRHAMILLSRVGDVRFYRTGKHRVLQLHTTELYYSWWLEAGAVEHQILDLDEEFQVWVPLDDSQLRSLILRQADSVVFSPLRR